MVPNFFSEDDILSSMRKWTDEQLIEAVKTSECKLDVLKKMGLKIPGSYKMITKYIQLLNIDISHFRTRAESAKPQRLWTNEEMFQKETDVDRKAVKRRILVEKLLTYECSDCKLHDVWNGKTIVLHLEHKNGDGRDNRLENLCFLCPNCHSQTKTYCGRNVKVRENFSCKCGTKINRQSKTCVTCYWNSKKGKPFLKVPKSKTA